MAAIHTAHALEQGDHRALVQRYAQEREMSTAVTVPPHMLQYNLHHVIRDRVARGLRGPSSCTERDGFVLQLTHITATRGGIIDERSGAVHYNVSYIAQCLRPVVGDVVEAIVTSVFKMGVFASLGPLSIFVPLSHLPDEFLFQTLPVPTFQPADEPSQAVRAGSEVHIRIEEMEMLDDDFRPSKSTRCVLKAMGELVGVRASGRSEKRLQQDQQPMAEFLSEHQF